MRKRTRSVLTIILVAAAAVGAVAVDGTKKYPPAYFSSRVYRVLKETYQSSADITGLGVSVFPLIRISGQSLVLRHSDLHASLWLRRDKPAGSRG